MTWNDVKKVLDKATPEQLSQPVAVWFGVKNREGYWDAPGSKQLHAQDLDVAHQNHESGHTYGMEELVLIVAANAPQPNG